MNKPLVWDSEIESCIWKTELLNMRLKEEFLMPCDIPCNLTCRKVNVEKPKGKFESIREGDKWGENWDKVEFELRAEIPEGWNGKKVVLFLDINGEGLVFSSGFPLQGITNASVFSPGFTRRIVQLFDECKGGEKILLTLDATASGYQGLAEFNHKKKMPQLLKDYQAYIEKARVCIWDEEVYQLTLDLDFLLSLLKTLDLHSVKRAKIVNCFRELLSCFKEDSKNVEKCRQILRTEFSKNASPSSLNVTAVGHAHLDLAYLWTLDETKRKCARTFSTQLRLLEKHPDYIFGASQAQNFEFLKQEYPDLYEKIKEMARNGRVEPLGGMWIESDCNMPSGESLIRQFLYGKNFFMDEFGINVRNVFLPDVFGLSAALPQIACKSGCKYFTTIKLNWNDYNKFPYTTFRWRGMEGSELIAHFPPEGNYSSDLSPETLKKGSDNFKEKIYLDEFLSLFGVGDGGGGPKDEYIEYALRAKDTEGSPKVKFGKVSEFFERLEAESDKLPVWSGELYFEGHRGTYTTHAKLKKYNRMLEGKIRAVEMLFSALPLNEYPDKEIEAAWKALLLNQFHDILTGSSIKKVYDEAVEAYEKVLEQCASLEDMAGKKLFIEKDGSFLVFNPLSIPYSAPLELPVEWDKCAICPKDGLQLKTQFENGKTIAMLDKIPALSFTEFNWTPHKERPDLEQNIHCEPLTLENKLVKYEFNNEGALVKAYDKELSYDFIAPGHKGNEFFLYEDRPAKYDAWEIDPFYEDLFLEHASSISHKIIANGPVRSGIEFSLKIGNSEITQKAFLGSNTKRLDFKTQIRWEENNKLLKVAFPVNLEASTSKIVYDMPHGFIERDTCHSTSWNDAKFEVAAHKYADISDGSIGAAILNDCKYGYSAYENLLKLTLLRSPKYPNDEADRGEHEFTYSFLPHKEALPFSNVIEEAEKLNIFPLLFKNKTCASPQIPLTVSGNGLFLEALKKAEKENLLIARVAEVKGRRSMCKLGFSNQFSRLVETNLIEWENGKSYNIENKKEIEVEFKPFEIKTFKLEK